MKVIERLVDEIYSLIGEKGFRWDKSIGRYRDKATGRLVSESWLRSRASEYAEKFVVPQIERHTSMLLEGKIELAVWQERVALEIKDAHIVQHMLGRGGYRSMTFSDWGKIGSRLKFEYQRLDQFAQQIKMQIPSAKQIAERVKLYARAAKVSFFDGSTEGKKEAEYTRERRVTTPAEHCDDCLHYESLGWQPIGTLPEPGTESQCGRNCKCYKEYAKEEE